MEFLSQSKSVEPTTLESENFEFLNYMQVRFSHHHVYSGQDEFSLVERILNGHPNWKLGLMPVFG
jgi:hypothetical protein